MRLILSHSVHDMTWKLAFRLEYLPRVMSDDSEGNRHSTGNQGLLEGCLSWLLSPRARNRYRRTLLNHPGEDSPGIFEACSRCCASWYCTACNDETFHFRYFITAAPLPDRHDTSK